MEDRLEIFVRAVAVPVRLRHFLQPFVRQVVPDCDEQICESCQRGGRLIDHL